MTQYPYFSDAELACSCCGEAKMDPGFMAKVIRIREIFDYPMVLSSAYRCPDYNAQVSSTGRSGPHTTGRSIDVKVYGPRAVRLLTVALDEGMLGIGVSQKDPHANRFLHLDDLSCRMWSY